MLWCRPGMVLVQPKGRWSKRLGRSDQGFYNLNRTAGERSEAPCTTKPASTRRQRGCVQAILPSSSRRWLCSSALLGVVRVPRPLASDGETARSRRPGRRLSRMKLLAATAPTQTEGRLVYTILRQRSLFGPRVQLPVRRRSTEHGARACDAATAGRSDFDREAQRGRSLALCGVDRRSWI